MFYPSNRDFALIAVGAVAMVAMCLLLLIEVRNEHIGQFYVIENGKWMPVAAHQQNKR